MPKSDTFKAEFLALIFHGTAIPTLAINATSSPVTTFYVGLHTADPGGAGTQSTFEVTYTGYLRVARSRTSGIWALTGVSISPIVNIDFGLVASGISTATHLSIGTASSGAGKLLFTGTLSPTIALAPGVTPRLTPATIIREI